MLTNEEKINLRERALRLALELPNPSIEWTTERWANAIYQFLSKDLDDDPFRLDAPSPTERAPEHLINLMREPIGEIYWSRPQIVRKWDSSPRILVKTTGVHSGENFEGIVIETNGNITFADGQFSSKFKKESFVYHGEIPEPDNQKISASQEPRTTGLNFIEAMKLCKEHGKNIRRPSFGPHPSFLYSSGGHLYWQDGEEAQLNEVEDILATDWQIIE